MVARLGNPPKARHVPSRLKLVQDQLAGKKKLDVEALSQGASARREALEARKPKSRSRTGTDAGLPEDPVARLQRMSSMPAPRCQAALRSCKGDLHAALRSMIASGHVQKGDLDPDLATEEHYALVEIKRVLDHQQSMDATMRRMGDITAQTLQDYRDQLSGKKAVEKRYLRLGQYWRDQALGPRAPKRPKKKPRALKIKPFPPLTDNGDWSGNDVLTSWAGFQSRGGSYTSRNSRRPSTGKVEVYVLGLPRGDDDDDGTPPPAAEQVAGYRHLKENQDKVRDAVVAAVFDEYPRIRTAYAIGDEEEDERCVPGTKDKRELRRLIGMGIVHVLDRAKAGHAYVGFEMGCTWDEEHGLGVLTHKGRVVEVGQADTAFDTNAAKTDGGKRIAASPARGSSAR
jgi:hypothetical protein